jgi:hypothetical protein
MEAARLCAIVNAAMLDAVNGTAGTGPRRHAAIVVAPRRGVADPVAAAAAHDVLAALYPASLGGTRDLGSRPSTRYVDELIA